MNQTTKLIVGSPFLMELGIPVSPVASERRGEVLRLDGPGKTTADVTPPVRRTIPLFAWLLANVNRPGLVITRRQLVCAALAAPLLAGVAWWAFQSSKSTPLPQVVAEEAPAIVALPPEPVVNVEQVNQSYPLTQEGNPAPEAPGLAFEPVKVEEQPATPLPTTPPKAAEVKPDSKTKAPTNDRSPAPGKHSGADVKSKTDTKSASSRTEDKNSKPQKEGVGSGVLLNEGSNDAPVKQSTAQVTHAADTPVEKPVSKSVTTMRLVALTPDGKSAIFADPTTRLPTQFKIGQRLPNGETLVGVSVTTGKATTSSKEYTLD